MYIKKCVVKNFCQKSGIWSIIIIRKSIKYEWLWKIHRNLVYKKDEPDLMEIIVQRIKNGILEKCYIYKDEKNNEENKGQVKLNGILYQDYKKVLK